MAQRDLLRTFESVLRLGLGEPVAAVDASEWGTDPEIDRMLVERQAARDAKDWATADRIRDELALREIEIVDTPEGARWRRKEAG